MTASDKTKWAADECRVFMGDGGISLHNVPNGVERARLIAAAPDLLEAALAVEALWEGDRAAAKEAGLDFDEEQAWASPVGVIWKQLRAAISKATGDA